jgi:hypothetical protein
MVRLGGHAIRIRSCFLAGICIRRAVAVNYVLISMKPFAGFDQTIRAKVLADSLPIT